MRKGQIYNREKVLYFANRNVFLHVQPDEPQNSDLSILVRELEGEGLIEAVVAPGQKGRFYETTRNGELESLRLQIAYRKKHNKPVAYHLTRKAELEGKW